MKNKFLVSIFLISFLSFVYGQTSRPETRIGNLPTIELKENVNIHFISPEPIQFVDLSTHALTGDLPAKNIARVKISVMDSLQTDDFGVITVVGQSFMAQYRVIYNPYSEVVLTNIQIQPEEMQPLEYANQKLSAIELKRLCEKIQQKKSKKPLRTEKAYRLKMLLNNVYVYEDYFFVDVSMENKTHISYDIDDIKFTIEDKKVYKATNNQSIALQPVYQFNRQQQFDKSYHNIFVFKKFTFPNSKVFTIRLIEDQISGRTIEMKIKYSDILNADTF